MTGSHRFLLALQFAEGPREFFAKGADIQIRFETDASGKATAFGLTQNGASGRAARVP